MESHTCNTGNHPTGHKLSDILGTALDHGTDDPDDGRGHQRHSAAKVIGEETGANGTAERTGGHGSGNLRELATPTTAAGQTYASLKGRGRMIEVLEVLICADPRAHGTARVSTC